ncbi:MAG: cytochrome C oxidase subunit IV family protein [Dehalococcoidia bacterium]|jgi:cytochrome c oxidase subunit 4|nr:cytochrome C oxidase subunit IV family protein [Dehalococcoidia bacterium]|tara:strand:+ start:187 stop:624 length:438 start_codon:yes stop_codon:yes gene_type:complete
MVNIWQKLTSHSGNGWWELPLTASAEADPLFEGLIGGAWLSNIWRTVTHGGVSHAGPGFYWLVGLFLGVITLLEVWLFNIEGLGGLYIPILLGLSALKFAAVVAFFMHLRFDHRLFTLVFAPIMVVGVAIFSALLLMAEFAGQNP